MGVRQVILWIWKLFDPIYYSCSRLHHLNSSKKYPSVFRVRITKYKGENYVLSDGTQISKNDLMLKIHLHNVRLLSECLKIKNELTRARRMYRMVLASMPGLASYVSQHSKEENIKGIIGITTINRAVAPLGFECCQPKNIWYRFFKKLGQIPIILLSGSSLKNLPKHHLTYLFLSKESLYAIYGQKRANN